jgi:hypothetical protein
MSNPVTPFRNNLFASRGCNVQEALNYAEMMINTLSATDQVSIRTAFGVVINTIDSAVTVWQGLEAQSQVPSPEMDQADMLSQLGGIYDKLVNDVASKVEAKIMTNDKIDESIEEWMTLNLRDKVMSIVEDDDIDDQISNWMSNNFDITDYNVDDAIESWADNNMDDKIQEAISNLTFNVTVS